MNRKDFLKTCAVLAGGAVGLDLTLAGCAPLPYAAYTLDDGAAVVRNADLDAAGFVLLDVAALPAPVYLTRSDDGYAAVLLHCTHRGCTVHPAGDRLRCPCHGSQYTPGGEVIEGPAPRNLQRFPVTAGADTLRIQLNPASSK